ncbi:UNVERIFIED_CONTAM: hypothetical protein GTU68_000218 [Idotea baltica]|nr:hypothetical protein [Idotea baltica]
MVNRLNLFNNNRGNPFLLVVHQEYVSEVHNEYVIRGNSALFKCTIPSYVADFVVVQAWVQDQEIIYPSSNYVVHQEYRTDVTPEYVISGNPAIVKCLIPSFAADFVTVQSWVTDAGDVYHPSDHYAVVSQDYLTQVMDESVLKGNSALFKCMIPSFVADFVEVQSWIENGGSSYYPSDQYVVAQKYITQVWDESVLKGNSALLKCVIPSFVADFVSVQSWVESGGKVFYQDQEYGNFITGKRRRFGNVFVTLGETGERRLTLFLFTGLCRALVYCIGFFLSGTNYFLFDQLFRRGT